MENSIYIVQSYFWKDSWISEEPYSRQYGNFEECLAHLEKIKIENSKYNPILDSVKNKLKYSTDGRRNYLHEIIEVTKLEKNGN